jgi:chromosome segregation ATPase
VHSATAEHHEDAAVAKLRDRIEALERRVGRRRAAHAKLAARAERIQRRMSELAAPIQEAEKALGEAVARVAARTRAKADRKASATVRPLRVRVVGDR